MCIITLFTSVGDLDKAVGVYVGVMTPSRVRDFPGPSVDKPQGGSCPQLPCYAFITDIHAFRLPNTSQNCFI